MMRETLFRRFVCVFLSMVLLISTVPVSLAAEGDTERSETVYITADVYGSPTDVLSSVYLSNPQAKETLTDRSVLTDVKNITSAETPKQQADGTWEIIVNAYGIQAAGIDSIEAAIAAYDGE